MDELPYADDYLSEPKQVEQEVISDYEKQKSLVHAELKKISKDKPSVTVTMFEVPDKKLVTDLESRGFVVKYKLNYDQSKTKCFFCKFRITNPKLVTNSEGVANDFLDNIEENLKNFGFSTTEGDCDAFKKLIADFLQ